MFSDRDVHAALAVLAEAASQDGPVPFSARVVELLGTVVRADRVGYFEYQAGGLARAERGAILIEVPGPPTPAFPWHEYDEAEIDRLWALADSRHSRTASGALLFSDFVGPRRRRRDEWYSVVMRPDDVEHECKLWLGGGRRAASGFFFLRSRGSPDFDERERALLSILRPHLIEVRARWARRHRPSELTAREAEILQLVTTGLSNKQIAHRLGLSPGTVRIHLAHVYAKLGVHNRTAAVRRGYEA